MATIVMREILAGEVPKDGGTAVQEDPERPVFRGNGPATRSPPKTTVSASTSARTASSAHGIAWTS